MSLTDGKFLPKPFFVLRGHSSEVQCVYFGKLELASCGRRSQYYLLSGDADGYVILWCLATFRPLAIWKPHTNAVLTISISLNNILTHGRDNKLHMWEIVDLESMDCSLPIHSQADTNQRREGSRKPPFMICSLDVNAMNFCQASTCLFTQVEGGQPEVLVAVPGLIGSGYLDIYSLPSTQRLVTRILAPQSGKTELGNVMAVDLKYPLLAVAYENGGVALFSLDIGAVNRETQKQDGLWHCIKQWSAHREAVLSVLLNTATSEMYSCGIDSRVIKYTLPEATSEHDSSADFRIVETRHSGQQSICLRSDKKLLITAGWDGFARIYTTAKLKQVAVLGFHKQGISSGAFKPKAMENEESLIALGSKDSKISLWKLY